PEPEPEPVAVTGFRKVRSRRLSTSPNRQRINRLKVMATMQEYAPLRERVYIGYVGPSVSDHDESLLPSRPCTYKG
ncbi:hypothetical protein GBAR_LOCUS28756, partial [Geodia barretti]